jgi:hypothetical protein
MEAVAMLDSLFLMQNFCCLCVMIGQASFVVGFIWKVQSWKSTCLALELSTWYLSVWYGCFQSVELVMSSLE